MTFCWTYFFVLILQELNAQNLSVIIWFINSQLQDLYFFLWCYNIIFHFPLIFKFLVLFKIYFFLILIIFSTCYILIDTFFSRSYHILLIAFSNSLIVPSIVVWVLSISLSSFYFIFNSSIWIYSFSTH